MKTVLVLFFMTLFGFGIKAQTTVDSLQLMKDVKVLSSDKMEGRMVGTRGSRKAQLYIINRFQEIGLRERFDTYEQSFFFQNDSKRTMGTNLIGYLKGTSNDWIVISAHYDHLGIGKPVNGDSIYNGADDNASGVAGLLAIAKYFKTRPPRHNLLFIAFDAEEEGLQGAKAFITQSKDLLLKIKLNINMDMISHSKKNELYASGTFQFPKLKPYLEGAGKTSNINLMFGHDGQNKNQDNWVNQSDQSAFYDAGIPFIYFGVENHPDYHSVSDSFKTITPFFFYHAVQTIISATEKLDKYLGIKVNIPPKSKWIMKKD